MKWACFVNNAIVEKIRNKGTRHLSGMVSRCSMGKRQPGWQFFAQQVQRFSQNTKRLYLTTNYRQIAGQFAQVELAHCRVYAASKRW